MTGHVLAQLNIARPRAPVDSPILADFVANLDRINALAECAPGFMWRLKEENGNATGLRPFGDDCIVNMSTWKDVESLVDYAFRSGHVEVMRRRREWFVPMEEAYAVLWWVPHGHHPDPTEARERLEHLRAHGPTPRAFTFRSPFPPPPGEGAIPSIRRAVPQDAAALATLAEQTFRDTFADANSPQDMALHCARAYSPQVQRAEIEDPAMATLVAGEGEGLQGYAQLRLRHATPCVALERPAELQRIYVARQWQGRGLAQSLMSAVLDLARSHGADGLWLGVWERNPRAIAFYSKLGFEARGEHVFQLGSDPQRDVVMALRFTPAVG